MKLQTLINRLQEIEKEQGNIEVTVDGGYWLQDPTDDYRFQSPWIGEVVPMGKYDEDGNPMSGGRQYRTLVLNKYTP